jgi:hypothetical protein
MCVCVCVCLCDQQFIKIKMQKSKWDKYFDEEVKTLYQQREKPLWGNQTQEIYYLEDKASYKAIVLI